MSVDPTALDVYKDLMDSEAEADAFIAEILESFYTDTGNLLQTLDHCLKKNDVDGFVRAVHTLKTTAATVGAQLLSGLAADLELRGETELLAHLQPRVTLLNEAFADAEKKLKEIHG